MEVLLGFVAGKRWTVPEDAARGWTDHQRELLSLHCVKCSYLEELEVSLAQSAYHKSGLVGRPIRYSVIRLVCSSEGNCIRFALLEHFNAEM